jgi:hypothetical protein
MNQATCDFGRFGICLLKNTYNLRFKFRKFEGEDRAAGMKDQVAALRQHVHVAAQSLSHAALDAVAFMGFTQNLTGGEADAWRCWARCLAVGGG